MVRCLQMSEIWRTPDYYRTVVVLGGDAPRGLAARCLAACLAAVPRPYVIAADKGAEILLAQQAWPDLLVGDGDSLAAAARQRLYSEVSCQRLPERKDFTDGEAALVAAAARGGRIAVLAADGGERIDFTLNHFFLPLRFSPEQRERIDIYGAAYVATYSSGRLEIAGHPGERLSLMALAGPVEGLSLGGLAYPLQRRTLPCATSLCLSNQLLAEQATITHDQGDLLVIYYPQID